MDPRVEPAGDKKGFDVKDIACEPWNATGP
jgi:hypothetical protein